MTLQELNNYVKLLEETLGLYEEKDIYSRLWSEIPNEELNIHNVNLAKIITQIEDNMLWIKELKKLRPEINV